MKYITSGDETYAILVSAKEKKEGTEWFGRDYEPLQCSRMNYKKGKEFKAHKHIVNPRIIKRTQEAFLVITGKIQIKIYDDNKKPLGTLKAGPGEVILVYKGYHLVKVLEDSICYEVKAGQFSSPTSEEKEFLNVREK